jgi:precorrin isomerase
MSGVKPKLSKLLRRHLNGESDGREDVEAPIMRDLVPEWDRRILCTVEHPRAAQISEKTQNARESAITEYRWFAGQRPVAWIT